MRTAICISGQPRFFKKGYEHIYKNIIEPNEADVFLHFWHDESQVDKPYDCASWNEGQTGTSEIDLENKIINLYKPKAYQFEPERTIFEGHNPINYYTKEIRCPVHILFSMFYSIYMANDLKSKYESENNFKYDAVIRTRFDLGILSKVKMNEYDLAKINFPDFMWYDNGAICDYLGFANSDVMNIYCDVYNNMTKIYDSDVISFAGENYLITHLKNNGIDILPQPISLFLLRNNELNSKFGKSYLKNEN